MKKNLFIATILFYTSVCNAQTSQTIDIGNQTWMQQNLDVDKFRNGDPIPHAKTNAEWINAGKNKQPAWCYLNNDPINGRKYGKLYNYYAAIDSRGLAPKGFKIPSKNDVEIIVNFLGGEKIAGLKLKSTLYWGDNAKGNNKSGLAILPTGIRDGDKGTFIDESTILGPFAYFWLKNDNHDEYVIFHVNGYLSPMNRNQNDTSVEFQKSLGYSKNKPTSGMAIRCIEE